LVRHPELKLVIVGDGERRQALTDQVTRMGLESHVHLAGQRKNVSDLLPAFDIFALPSQTEGVSIALLEACATGLAVIATRVGGNPEIIHDQETGLLISPDDNAALLAALIQMIESQALRQKLGQRAAAWVRQHASDQTLREAYDQCYARARLRA
jgi:glycosyltransferase involved in cell wall biosynthesis